jgi:nucleotide-binding universal stress UspA family protein
MRSALKAGSMMPDMDAPPVVVGVDGSPASSAAVDWASAYASVTGRALVIVHCASTTGRESTARQVEGLTSIAFDRSRALVDALVERATATHTDVTAVGVTEFGYPLDVLLDRSRTATLLVLGHRRRGTFAPFRPSLSSRLVRRSTCPVLVYPV